MAVSSETLLDGGTDIEHFRVSDEVVLEMLGKQSQSLIIRDALVKEIRETESRIDRCLLGFHQKKGIDSRGYFVISLSGALQMCSAITVSRIYRELGWGKAYCFSLPEQGSCFLLVKNGADFPGLNLKVISKAMEGGVMLTLGS